jgi:hypothetical protein
MLGTRIEVRTQTLSIRRRASLPTIAPPETNIDRGASHWCCQDEETVNESERLSKLEEGQPQTGGVSETERDLYYAIKCVQTYEAARERLSPACCIRPMLSNIQRR